MSDDTGFNLSSQQSCSPATMGVSTVCVSSRLNCLIMQTISTVCEKEIVWAERLCEITIPRANLTSLRSLISQCSFSWALNFSFSSQEEAADSMLSTCTRKMIVPDGVCL